MESQTRLLGIGTANPGKSYQQSEIAEMLGVMDTKIARIFNNSHIKTRNVCFTDFDENGAVKEETSLDLWNKHRKYAVETAEKAIENALEIAGLTVNDIDYIACVTSTGFLCPGLSAHLIKNMGFRQNTQRIDIVGMGCNAGLNGMQPVTNFCKLHPEKFGLLVCSEVCSALYVKDDTIGTAVVNSLFGDGSTAAVFGNRSELKEGVGAEILAFESFIIPDHIDAMRFDFNGDKYEFYLDRQIPYVLGNNIEKPVKALLKKHGLKIRDIDHWVVHSGGRKVIDSIKYNLDISSHDVRHTIDVLREYGNLSSGAFLFSYKRLIDENIAKKGDNLFIITMGPGTTVECCLGKF
ncbi:3,5-dihydroxyphenylacetyl-CoA synthase DpgA [uncultured Kordia sp.]|uniref:3,5-dihydroxyphenylacetyl-CoA synthase DpgA n=1 Tax=uncultured Kordia sp. TaxID=507699 RepID=UPI00261F46CC|nr:3,5-dihydroxyphenylacetyl-CoA synthase DpgA [uncultured Kordia sp.]